MLLNYVILICFFTLYILCNEYKAFCDWSTDEHHNLPTLITECQMFSKRMSCRASEPLQFVYPPTGTVSFITGRSESTVLYRGMKELHNTEGATRCTYCISVHVFLQCKWPFFFFFLTGVLALNFKGNIRFFSKAQRGCAHGICSTLVCLFNLSNITWLLSLKRQWAYNAKNSGKIQLSCLVLYRPGVGWVLFQLYSLCLHWGSLDWR